MVTQRDYTAEAVAAARSVLIEVIHLLGEYREDVVLVGGWMPEILLGGKKKPHIRSIDVDLALNHLKLKEGGYKTIQDLLLGRGYEQGEQPFIFHKEVSVTGRPVTVEVDLLAGQYERAGKGHRHQRIQGGLARKARGCDLAFQDPVVVTVEGELPGGARAGVKVRVASIVTFLVMKSMALDDRMKEKDAWDIYYCLQNYPGGLDSLVDAFRPHVEHGLVREGLQKMAKHFASEKAVGPTFVADFEELAAGEDREIRERDAYERVAYFLEELGID
ncbi:MAG: nucleotidyl transferase AbiEii/AbiGii toxin family protein [Thermodesulfobacteriota bacterium]|nr:nucleotidyl transferase AbiEii/AbiGii toxin family protein [Thermodesulfobacteriota bacterium]